MAEKRAVIRAFPGMLTGRMNARTGRALGNAAFSALAGLLGARAAIFSGLAPFGIAVVAAVPGPAGLFALVGAAMGYLLPGGPQYGARYVVACMAAFLFARVFDGFARVAKSVLFRPVAAGAACLITGMAVVISNGLAPADLALCLAETALCAVAAAFFEKSGPLLRHPARIWGVGRPEMVSLMAAAGVGLLALTGIGVSGVTLGRTAAVVLILIAARTRREAGGSIVGTALALCFTLSGRGAIEIVAGYAFGGLMAGVFAQMGRFGCVVAFILGNAAAAFSAGFSAQSATGIYEAMIGAVVFLLLPEQAVGRVASLLGPSADRADDGRQEALPRRLAEAARTLCAVSDTVTQVGDRLRGIGAENVTAVYERASETTCAHCGMRMYCWGTGYNDTMNVLNGLTATLTRDGRLEREDVPQHFAGRCCRLGELLAAVNRSYAEYAVRRREQGKNEILRGVLAEQFTGVAAFLKELAQNACGAARPVAGGEKVQAALRDAGLSVEEATCRVDERGRMSVEADIRRRGKMAVNRTQVLREVSRACGRPFEGPVFTGDGETLRVGFTEKPAFTAAFGRASVAKSGEKLCGDACDAFVDDAGRALLILSDGMGCGGPAAVDSRFTLDLASRLLQAGFGFDSMVRIVNSAMILKSGDESFATLDIAAIDLYSGETEFLKAGAPPTYVRRSGRVERVVLSSIPVGLLRDTGLERSRTRLRRGDVVVVVSDGALASEDSWLVRSVEAYAGEPPDEFAAALAQKAKDARIDGHDDDITVLVGVLE